jgi:hypothetical protein
VFYVQKTIFLAMEYAPFDMGALFTHYSGQEKPRIALKDEHVKNLF